MTATAYVLGIVAALLALGFVVEMLRRRRLRERHAIYWLVAGILALVVSVFPSTLSSVASLVGVSVPTNLIFFVSIAILFLVSVQQSSELTGIEQRVRLLVETGALQRLRIEELERRVEELAALRDPEPDEEPLHPVERPGEHGAR